jgi:tetratricopeptide (TPR) repeat protein
LLNRSLTALKLGKHALFLSRIGEAVALFIIRTKRQISSKQLELPFTIASAVPGEHKSALMDAAQAAKLLSADAAKLDNSLMLSKAYFRVGMALTEMGRWEKALLMYKKCSMACKENIALLCEMQKAIALASVQWLAKACHCCMLSIHKWPPFMHICYKISLPHSCRDQYIIAAAHETR